MSATATTTIATPTARQLSQIPDDYTIHLTGGETDTVNNQTASEPRAETPANWPQDYHGVPEYRPINPHLNPAERGGSGDPVEALFIYTMLRGVWLNAVSCLS